MQSGSRVEKLSEGSNLVDRWCRAAVVRRLAGLSRGRIELVDAAGSLPLGEASELRATVEVHRARFFRDAALGGELAVAQAYFRGDWDCDDLTALFRIFVRNRRTADRFDGRLAILSRLRHQAYHWLHANSRTGSSRNIRAHYDLGNDFFRLWLDDTMAYSSGVFADRQASLREASVEKFDRVCRKLQLQPSDEVVEIGSGWGGLAIHAAGRYGCRVTTTTISAEQFAWARRRIDEAGLADRITLLQQDYRDLTGQFDKLASIEMIEAVGHRYFDQYFGQCSRLLRDDGSLVLQAIIMPDREYARYLRTVDVIQRFVFPGGCLPSLGAILESVGRATDLRLVHAEDFAPHYAETLRRWRRNFECRLDDVRGLGYSTEFIRLWRYYLCYCEAAFEERYIGVMQLQFDKPGRQGEAAASDAGANEPLPATAGRRAPRRRPSARAGWRARSDG